MLPFCALGTAAVMLFYCKTPALLHLQWFAAQGQHVRANSENLKASGENSARSTQENNEKPNNNCCN